LCIDLFWSLPNYDAVFSYTVTGGLGSGCTVESTGISGQAQRKEQ